ncbi:MAG: hypothetical protein H5T83_03325, partial [Actinotalea sp.]|nr:hypothetical protein [Actinotalea sp.]
DDDPDFLWRLERERRRRELDGDAGATDAEGGSTPSSDGPPEPPRADDDDSGPARGSGRDAGAGKDDDGRG